MRAGEISLRHGSQRVNEGAYKRSKYVLPVTHGPHDMWYELTTKGYPLERVASCYLETT